MTSSFARHAVPALLVVAAAAAVSVVTHPSRNPALRGTDQVRVVSTAPSAEGRSSSTPTTTAAPAPRAPRTTLIVSPDPWRPEIRIEFHRAMDRASVQAHLRTSPPLSTTLAWTADQLSIRPTVALTPSKRYTFTLEAGATGLDGTALSKDIVQVVVPRPVVSLVRAPHRPGAPLELRFAAAMAASSVTASLRADFAHTRHWNAEHTILSLQPMALEDRTRYAVHFVRPLVSRAGSAVPAPNPVRFVAPAPIAAIEPTGDNAPLGAPLTVRFDRPIDAAAIAAAVHIHPPLAGAFDVPSPGEVRFRPAAPGWSEETQYTISLDPLTAADGTTLLRLPYTTTFRTGSYEPYWTFGSGPRIQLVAAGGPRTLVLAAVPAAPAGRLSLRPVDEAPFLARLRDALPYEPPATDALAPVDSRPIWTVALDAPAAPEGGGSGSEPASGAQFDNPTYAPPRPVTTTLPADAAPGFYELAASSLRTDDRLLVLIARNALALKLSPRQAAAWVADASTGHPTADADVTLFDAAGRAVVNGRTDADGLFRAPLTGDADAVPVLAVARHAGDVTVSGADVVWQSDGESARWGWWGAEQPKAATHSVHVHTDRPIYRPGQTVHFKAVVRTDDDGTLGTPPSGTALTVRVKDARGNVLDTQSLATGPFGTINGDLALAEGVVLGTYTAEVTVDGDGTVHRQPFQVEDYRKADLSVEVHASAAAVDDGDAVTVTGRAAYFYGAPAAGAEVALRTFTVEQGWGEWGEWMAGEDGDEASPPPPADRWIDQAATPLTATTDAAGRFTATLQVVHPYRDSNGHPTTAPARIGFDVTVDDGSGQAVGAAATIDVRGSNDVGTPDGGTSHSAGSAADAVDAFTVTADRPSYVPGDVAHLEISAPAPGPALLTIERGTVRRARRIELTGVTTRIDLPVEDADAPNVVVGIAAWQDRDGRSRRGWWGGTALRGGDKVLRTATVPITVVPAARRLTVTLTPDRSAYAPRDTAAVRLTVTDASGAPVAAEVSLAAVDEAIFALRTESGGPLFESFYRRRPHRVRTYDSLAPERALPCECGGGGGGGDGFSGADPRAVFADTALWLPAVTTDATGQAVVRVPLPDNLTDWRLTARAVALDARFGEARAVLATRQSLVVTPLLPRILVAGDSVLLSAIVHNGADAPVSVSVTLQAAGLVVSSRPNQRFPLAAGERRIVGWRADTFASGTTTVTVAAEALFAPTADTRPVRASDAVRRTIPVKALAVPVRQSWSGAATGSAELRVTVPEGALPDGGVELTIDRSIAGTLLSGVEDLVGYPYGCVEQTMSKALPNAVVSRALGRVAADAARIAELDAYVRAGVQRLYGLQHEDGGWGWWYDDDTDAYQTAWVIHGLAVTAESGHAVDPAVIARGADALAEHLGDLDPRTRAYALYALALAGRGDAAAAHALADAPASAPVAGDAFAQAALALALEQVGDAERARQIVDRLITKALRSDGRAHWGAGLNDGTYHDKTMASDIRTTALVLKAIVALRPGHALEGEAVAWLMTHRQAGSGWGTTNETSFALLGLTDHVVRTKAAGEARVAYAVAIDGVPFAASHLSASENDVTVRIPVSALGEGAHRIVLTSPGGATLYYAGRARFGIPRPAIVADGTVRVGRTFARPTGKPVGRVAVGEVIQVTVTVDFPASAHYVIVEDPLPGGLEALNTGLANTSRVASGFEADDGGSWRTNGYNHKEVRADRVSFFVTDIEPGRRTFTYLARATRPGTFHALPAEAWAMYDTGTWGRSASGALAVVDAAAFAAGRRIRGAR